jgi:hypothetical protein
MNKHGRQPRCCGWRYFVKVSDGSGIVISVGIIAGGKFANCSQTSYKKIDPMQLTSARGAGIITNVS